MINFILCDNEPAITESVKSIITRMMFKNNVGYKIHIFNSYNTSFNTIMNSGLENKIYILDIEVGSKSGIEIAKKTAELYLSGMSYEEALQRAMVISKK